jgi:hypothetical protein
MHRVKRSFDKFGSGNRFSSGRGGRGRGRGGFKPSSFSRPRPFKSEKEREIHSKLQRVEANLQPKRLEEEKQGSNEEARSMKTDVLLDNLRKQLEFYFGDPNLTKDKNLREIMQKDSRKKGYVALETFLTFNRIKDFFFENEVKDEKDRHRHLEKAIKRSKLLKLDSAKEGVRRRVPFDFRLFTNPKFRESVNDRTIFVDHLPGFVDQEILARAFKSHGKILYISIPKDKDKKVKGFAFIEYSVVSG